MLGVTSQGGLAQIGKDNLGRWGSDTTRWRWVWWQDARVTRFVGGQIMTRTTGITVGCPQHWITGSNLQGRVTLVRVINDKQAR